MTTPTTATAATATPIQSATATRGVYHGIGWSGSLVGSNNPNNLGYRDSNPLKRYKRSSDTTNGNLSSLKGDIPSNIVIQFRNRQGELLATPLDVPTNSSLDDLQTLVQSLLDDNNNDGHHHIVGRHIGQCPDIDGQVILVMDDDIDDHHHHHHLCAGQRCWVEIIGYHEYDVIGKVLVSEEQQQSSSDGENTSSRPTRGRRQGRRKNRSRSSSSSTRRAMIG